MATTFLESNPGFPLHTARTLPPRDQKVRRELKVKEPIEQIGRGDPTVLAG
ncbi:MAG TPA: hypothetical protein VE985_00700 [Gaiellaceae bacterium]|nr:hypothetical protein [Gaiellaceae bacterium]